MQTISEPADTGRQAGLMENQAQRPGAARISKGAQPLLILSEMEVRELLDPAVLLDALADGFRALAEGRVQAPPRPEIVVPAKGFSLAMPAWVPGMPVCVKVVNVFEGNLALDLPNHLALITLFDSATGLPLCVMDGTYITGLRTAAAAILSVRVLARPEAKVATLVGAGVQGREHLRLLPLVRDLAEIHIASLHGADAEDLAARDPRARVVDDLEAAVRGSDIVCLATHAYEPVIDAAWLRPGTHVTSVGYAPPRGELPPQLLRDVKQGNVRLFVETMDAFASPPVGCAELASLSAADAVTLGDLLLARGAGRRDAAEITLYKAMGVAMEDMVAADLVYRRALQQGIGSWATI